MSQLATFTEFHDYFNAIATSHVDITGFKFGDKDVVASSSRSNLTTCELWLQEYEPVNVLDNYSDNHLGQVQSSLTIMKVKPELWEDQRTIIDETEVIAKQIISKMLKDFNEGLQLIILNRYKYGQADLDLGATKYMGCRLDFVILRPERLVYDELKWA